MPIPTFTMQLEWAELISPGVRHLAFKLLDKDDFSFIPGQFITLHFEAGGQMLKRSYSIASIPGQTDLIEFAAGYFEGGPGTELLFSIKPGDKVTTSGPFGRLVLRDEPVSRYVLVATGTGVTPYRAMLPSLAERFANDPNLRVVLLLGVRSRIDAIYADDFRHFAKQHPQFELRLHYSRETDWQSASADEFEGYVQTGFEPLALKPDTDIVYLCGNPLMVDQAYQSLQAQGFETRTVRREKYISSK